jgi:hypothetical protein
VNPKDYAIKKSIKSHPLTLKMKEPQNVYTVPLPQPIPLNNDMYWHLITGVNST